MKSLLPYDKQELLINIPQDEFLNALKTHIQVTEYLYLFKDSKSKQFFGEIRNDVFIFRLKTEYWNFLKPFTYLKSYPKGDKTRIILEFKLHAAVKPVMFVLLTILSAITIFSIADQMPVETVMIPIGFVAFSLLIINIAFYMSLDHTVEAINKIIRQIIFNSGRRP
jgi:hypothetical protein